MSIENKNIEKDQEGLNIDNLNRVPLSEWSSKHSDIFIKEDLVGQGTFGKVFKAKFKNPQIIAENKYPHQEYVALKKILMHNETEGFPITAIRELSILKRLNHNNVIKLYDIVTSKPSEANKFRGSAYLVFEYMEHDLIGLMDRNIIFGIPEIKCIIYQILLGVEYLHKNNIMHRDIKGSNILMNNKGQVKIADFGLARNYTPNSNQLYTNRVVTLWYRAPEILLGSHKYDTAIDIWSVGCVFSEILCGIAPFRGSKEIDQIEKIFEKCGIPTDESWPGVSVLKYYNQFCPRQKYIRKLSSYYLDNKKVDSFALDLLEKMLELNPAKRITATEALKHPYFQSEPKMCEPNQMPLIEKESHEYQAKNYKKKNEKGIQNYFGAGPVNNNINQQREMIVGNSSYHDGLLRHKRHHHNGRKTSQDDDKNSNKKQE